MSVLILPSRFTSQPQYAAPIDQVNPLASGLVSATIFDNAGGAIDRITGARYPVTNGTHRIDKPGRVTSFAGAGYVNTGKQSLGGVNLFADSTSQWSVVIYARIEGTGNIGTFLGKAGGTGASRTLQLYRDTVAGQDPAIWIRGALSSLSWGWSAADWHQYTITWDGLAAKAFGDYDKETIVSVGSAAQESENIVFGARTGGSGGQLTGRIAYGYFYNRAISRAESIALYENPWQVFKAPTRRLWAASATTDYTLTADPSAFALTGAEASLEYNRLLAATQGSFAVTATAATLKRGYALQADSASFALSGTDAELRLDRVLQTGSASSQIAGTDASLEYNRVLPAESASFQIVGTDATFVHDAPGIYTLSAEPTSFGVSAQPATLKYSRRLSADSASFAFTGSAASLRYARAVIAEAAVYALTGTDANLTIAGRVVSASRTYAVPAENRTYTVPL